MAVPGVGPTQSRHLQLQAQRSKYGFLCSLSSLSFGGSASGAWGGCKLDCRCEATAARVEAFLALAAKAVRDLVVEVVEAKMSV